MPKTRFQDWIFSIIMVLVMVYCMTLYNALLASGFQADVLRRALYAMWSEALVAFLLQRFVAGILTKKLVMRLVRPELERQIVLVLAMTTCTVLMMAPMMTFFVTWMHHGFTEGFLREWLFALLVNMPFAFAAQLFVVGPLVRRVFRLLFRAERVKR